MMIGVQDDPEGDDPEGDAKAICNRVRWQW